MLNDGVCIDLVILQETWKVNFPDLLEIPGFQKVIFNTQQNIRGGGVGFYIRKGLNLKIRNDLSCFSTKTFENLTIELSFPNKPIFISNIYHSPNPPTNTSLMDHSNNFLEKLDNHLSNLSALNKDVYVFLDANIDLLKLNMVNLCNDYMDVNLSNGFIQLICRATRIQGPHFSLIDHTRINKHESTILRGWHYCV